MPSRGDQSSDTGPFGWTRFRRRFRRPVQATGAAIGQDMLTVVSTNMPQGGSVNPEIAQQILSAVPQYQAFFDGSAKRYCK